MKSVLDPVAHKKGDQKGHKRAGERKLATARAIARFSHPYLVEMRSLSDEEVEFEPELRGGMRLSDICRQRFASGPAPLAFGLRILLDALSGLAALHGSSLGFAHGEMAPCNVVVGADGRARLVPVVAAHFLEAAPPGTDAAGFAAPERLRCDPFDHRADVFSVGVMLWEMITGRSFRGLPAEIITAWVVDGKVPDPVHPDDAPWVVKLAAVATRALAVQPELRWPHVGIMGEEIEKAAEGHVAWVREVRDLLADATQGKPAASPSENPWTPSLSPTAVSIPPTPIPPPPIPPAIQGLYATAPLVHESAAPPTRRAGKSRRRQSVIAWSTLLTAVVLLALATHEVLEGLAASRSVAAGAPAPHLAARKAAPSAAAPALPAPTPSAEVAPAVASAPPNTPAPAATTPPASSSPPVAAPAPSVPARRVRRAPRKVAPPPPVAVPKPPKGREDTFGI